MAELAQRRPPAVASTGYLKVLPPGGRWILHADARARGLLAPVWGAGCSEEACRATVSGARATLWLGPDEYLLLDLGTDVSDHDAHASTAQSLEHALAGAPHALVDVSHRQFAVEVTGPHAAMILSAACPLDLDSRVFPVGMCTRTVLAKADIVLWRTAPATFHLEAWRSFAPYVSDLLGEIAREFYGEAP
ncbi:MAG TPA: sarcosine oxidase subunit gamma family protein [Steroidobacteraceae bacterium]|jgi:sarcosine oxidase subunit gamma|nr:sarcosine oxidase subunit gamma family protein [Steroidobacteraceae bacterium]